MFVHTFTGIMLTRPAKRKPDSKSIGLARFGPVPQRRRPTWTIDPQLRLTGFSPGIDMVLA
jgi:hypothetical protein